MKFHRVRNSVTVRLILSLVIICLIMGRASRMSAHNPGFTQSAPTKIASSITINGTIDSGGTETVWAPASQLDLLPNNCADFNADTGQPFNLYSLNDGTNLYLAFDIPDTSPSNQDSLFLIFDPNHSGGASLGVGDRALHLIFSNTAASNTAPTVADSEHYQVAVGGVWPAPTAGLPAGVVARYSRFPDKWQVEMRLPLAFFPVAAGGTMGAAFLYLNKYGAEDCDSDGFFDDFYAAFPSSLSLLANLPVLNQVMNPSLWGDLNLGPAIPTVAFQPPLCCHSADIDFTPAAQPFTAGTPVDIRAQVHNLHPSSVANNVNVEIRVHNFGTGGTVIAPFPLSTVIPSIAASSSSFSSPVTWPSPPAGLHGCIRAEIKPPTDVNSPYTIAGGQATAQHNIDVACIPQGLKKEFRFMAFNPEPERQLMIRLAAQQLLPPDLKGLKFELKQPDRPLKPQEEWPVLLVVDATADVPITEVPKRRFQLPATAGGTAVPPLRERSGTEPVVVEVNRGDRLHLSATGAVDLDGRGPIPVTGPDGRDVTKELGGQRRFLLADASASKFGGALIGSFDAFETSFLIGSEMTLTAPDKAERLWLAVNDIDGGYGDNTGAGFDVEISTLPPLQAAGGLKRAAQAEQVTLPQLNIAAVSAARITTGDRLVYNLLTNHGGLTYQFLVVDAKSHGGGGFLHTPFGFPWWLIYPLLLLLLLAFLLFAWLHRRRTRLQTRHV